MFFSPSPTPCGGSDLLLGDTYTFLSYFNDSSPDYETFCFDIEEKSSGNRFLFADRSDSHLEEFTNELAHIISPQEYDHFYFDLEDINSLDPPESTSVIDESTLLVTPLPDSKEISLREVERFDLFFSLTQSGEKTRVMETTSFGFYHMPSPRPAAYSPKEVMYRFYHPHHTSGDGFDHENETEEEEQARLVREKTKKVEEANISWDNVQAMIEADRLLAERLQGREQEELTDEEKARLFVEFLEKRKKHYNIKRSRKEEQATN
ncbi:hypothetical protein Tco_0332890 [Tanacetum coccineum]